LQVDDEDLARKSGDKEEKRTQKENLTDNDGKERLQIPGKMVGADTRVVRPGRECTEELAKKQSRKGKDGGDKRAGPTAPKVSNLGDRFSEEYLNRIALKVAKNRSAEDRSDNDQTEEADADVVVDICVGTV
jgi:hypothetical protein